MPRPPQAAPLAALRQQRIAADAALHAAITEVEAAQRARDAARLQPGADADGAAARYVQAQADYLAQRAERNNLLAQVAAQSAAAARADDDAASAQLFEGLEGDQPIALLPVRLETRYSRNALGQVDLLRLRIYPDDLHVQRHVAALTAAEQAAGQRYWSARFEGHAPQADGEPDEAWQARRQRGAALWAELVRALRAPRAAHVVQRLRPANAALLDGPPALLPVPEFPDVGAPGSRLSAQPQAVMLPDRFCAIGLVAGQVVFMRFGEPVPDVLAAAPVIHPGDPVDPGDAEAPVQTDPFGGESHWLADYGAALQQGMAINIAQQDVDAWRAAHPGTPAFNLAQPLDQLIVLGVDWTLAPDDAAAGLGALLESHAAAGGLAFLPIGTPTNNTGAASSGYTPASQRDPTTPEPPAPAPGTPALEGLRFALGLPDSQLTASNLPHQQLADAETARHMLNALYRALAGKFLEEHWGDPQDPPARRRQRLQALDALRDHVTTYLRPVGPLQPLRVGTQPYGLLPVVATGAYQGDDATETTIKQVLDLLRPSWQGVLHKTARFDGQATTTHGLLRHGPWAQAVSYREVAQDSIGSAARQEIEHLQQQLRFGQHSLFVQALGATWGKSQALPALLAALPVATLTFQPQPSKLPAGMPWVQADAEVKHREAADDAALTPNYLSDIAASIDPLRDAKRDLAGLRRAPSLLQGLAAYSVDLEIDAANARAISNVPSTNGLGIGALTQSPRVINLEDSDNPAGLTTVRHIGQLHSLKVPTLTGQDTLGQRSLRTAHALVAGGLASIPSWTDEPWRARLDRVRLSNQPDLRHLASVKASLLALKDRPVGELNWALRSTLAAFDDRLDAWYTSLATRRLAKLRAGQDEQGEPLRRTGVHVGAYGWVERLQPDPPGHRESRGHILAPSMRHAAAAAVLRSGYLANDPAARQAFTLDLSSRRVRAARGLFEGLAQGQPLAALIGYQFERGLRNALLAQHILTFRMRYPMRPPPSPAANVAEETIMARDVTDGVKLLADGAGGANLVPAGPARTQVQRLLAEMADLWDAACDVAVTEGVYQVTQGNMERAAAALAVLDKQATPVEPQSVLSPRDGVRYTQRLVLLMDPAAVAPADWPVDALSRAEPALNAWLAELIGPPERFALTGRALTDGNVVQPLALNPAQLGLSPLALMLALDAPGGGRTDAQVMSHGEAATDPAQPALEELSRLRLGLVEALFRQAAEQLPGQAVRLQVDEQASAGPGQVTGLVQLEALLGLARRLVTQARPAVQRDLAVTEGRFDAGAPEGDHPGVDAAELDTRAQTAVAALQAAHDTLAQALAAADAAATLAALRETRGFGIPGAVADDHVARTPEAADAATLQRGTLVLVSLAALLAQVAEIRSGLDLASTPGKLAPLAIDTLKAVFGRGFPVLPRFVMGPVAAELQAGLDAQAMLTQGRPEAVVGWLPKLAKVRRGVEQLQSLLLAREVLVAPFATQRFAVWQSTGRTGGRHTRAPWAQPWMALPEAWPDGPEPNVLGQAHQRPDLAVAALLPDSLRPGQAVVRDDTLFTGVVCDDWSETVPLHTQTAAVAFHYDAPGARAPQSVLLAVPPRSGMAWWDFDTVLATVREAIALSRLRLVKPADLEGLVNLALPLNLVRDGKAPEAAGMGIKLLAETSLHTTVAGLHTQVLAAGKT
jgi:hypothetical protein